MTRDEIVESIEKTICALRTLRRAIKKTKKWKRDAKCAAYARLVGSGAIEPKSR